MNLAELLQVKAYQEGSNFWVYTHGGGRRIGYYFTWGRGCYLDYDWETFRWRSEYEEYLIKMIRREFSIVLPVVINA